MDADLAARMPGLARYLAVCFPALRRLDVVVARAGARRLLEVTFAFRASNIEHLFKTEIAPPCDSHQLLAAFARLEADLRRAADQEQLCPTNPSA